MFEGSKEKNSSVAKSIVVDGGLFYLPEQNNFLSLLNSNDIRLSGRVSMSSIQRMETDLINYLRLDFSPNELGGYSFGMNNIPKVGSDNFEKLVVKYKSTIDLNECKLSGKINFIGTSSTGGMHKFESEFGPHVKYIDKTESVAWNYNEDVVLPQDYRYLLARLGYPKYRNTWFYKESNGTKVYKNVVNIPIKDAKSIKIQLDSSISKVNYRYKINSSDISYKNMLWDDTSHTTDSYGGKNSIVFEVGSKITNVISKSLFNENTPVIYEIILFNENEPHLKNKVNLPRDISVKYIDQQSLLSYSSNISVSAYQAIGPNLYQMTMDLPDNLLSDKAPFNKINGNIWGIQSSCFSEIVSIDLLKFKSASIPRWISDANDWLINRGVITFKTDSDISVENLIKWPSLIAHIQFKDFVGTPMHPVFIINNNLQDLHLKKRFFQPLSHTGAHFKQSPEMHLSFTSNGLEVFARNNFDILWASNILIPKNAKIFIKASSKDDDVLRGSIKLEFLDGQEYQVPWKEGSTVGLDNFVGRTLKSVFLSLSLNESWQKVEISEFSLFVVNQVFQNAAIHLPVANWHWIDANDSVNTFKKLDHISNNISLPLNVKKSEIGGLRIRYEGPDDMINKCWLWLKINGEKNSYRSIFCPIDKNGVITLSNEFIGTSSFPSDEVIKNIEWGVIDNLIPLNSTVRIIPSYALFNNSSISTLLHSSLSARFGDTLFRPVITQQFWHKLATGPVWLEYQPVRNLLDDSNLEGQYSISDLVKFLEWRLIANGAEFYKLDSIHSSLIETNNSVQYMIFWKFLYFTVSTFLIIIFIFRNALIVKINSITSKNLYHISFFINKLIYSNLLVLPIKFAYRYGLLGLKGRLLRCSLLVVILYIFGLVQIGQTGENYFLTFGALMLVVVGRICISRYRLALYNRWPAVSETIHSSEGFVYFTGAFVAISCSALFLLTGWSFLAQHTGVVAFYCLVVGAVKELFDTYFMEANPNGSP